MDKNESKFVLNRLLVQLYGDILKIEEKSLQEGEFSDLSVTEIHIIEAIGIKGCRTMSEIAYDVLKRIEEWFLLILQIEENLLMIIMPNFMLI